MDKPFHIVFENEVLIVRFLREPTLNEYQDAIDAVSNKDSNQIRLWDISCGLKWPSESIQALGRYAKSKLASSGDLVAVYAPDNLTYGLFRMNGVYREDNHVSYRVFRDWEDALNWLKKTNA